MENKTLEELLKLDENQLIIENQLQAEEIEALKEENAKIYKALAIIQIKNALKKR